MTILDTYSFISLYCFSARLSAVRVAVREQFVQWKSAFPIIEHEGRIDLSRIYVNAPLAGAAHPKRVMLFTPRAASDRTVMFVNREDGGVSLAVCVGKRMCSIGYGFSIGSEHAVYPMYRFEVLECGKETRIVYLMKDPRWVFYEKGEPHPAEDPQRYKSLRAKNRMSREYLVAVANRLGLAIDDDAFWESDSPAVYFEEQQPGQS